MASTVEQNSHNIPKSCNYFLLRLSWIPSWRRSRTCLSGLANRVESREVVVKVDRSREHLSTSLVGLQWEKRKILLLGSCVLFCLSFLAVGEECGYLVSETHVSCVGL